MKDSVSMTVSRRTFLAAVPVSAAAVACRDKPRPAPDPDAAALASARDTELRLVLASDGPARDAHLAHLRALGGTPPTVLPPSSPATGLLHSSAVKLQAAAIGAHSGQVAATLASIAAAHLARP
ncbi:MAG: hypothetical protein QOC82_3132 [Frankiaceae bacterium]|nr:hypothetical protein [Frankiaceae bacterium]